MNSPQEPVSPSPSTPSSGSPSLEDNHVLTPPLPSTSQQREQNNTKRRLPAGSGRDQKSRRRDDGGLQRTHTQGDFSLGGMREGNRRDDLLDVELMEELKQGIVIPLIQSVRCFTDLGDVEFGDPFSTNASDQLPTQA